MSDSAEKSLPINELASLHQAKDEIEYRAACETCGRQWIGGKEVLSKDVLGLKIQLKAEIWSLAHNAYDPIAVEVVEDMLDRYVTALTAEQATEIERLKTEETQ